MEQLVQSRFAYIQSYQNDLFAEQRQTEGEVGSYESLAFTAYGGGNQDDFLIRIAHHEEQVGAQAAEGFRHDVVVVFAYGNGQTLHACLNR